jgi:hypothetical protein
MNSLLTETAGYVIFSLFLGGILKDRLGNVELNQLAQEEEPGKIGQAGGLLHVVGDDDNGCNVLDLKEQLFNFQGGDGIERGTRLVEQKHFGLNRQSARNAQTLLLAAGQSGGGLLQFVFDLTPKGSVGQATMFLLLMPFTRKP